jgi:hypothetical protein
MRPVHPLKWLFVAFRGREQQRENENEDYGGEGWPIPETLHYFEKVTIVLEKRTMLEFETSMILILLKVISLSE